MSKTTYTIREVPVRELRGGAWVTLYVDIELSIDLPAIAAQLVSSARKNKTKRATRLHGAVKVVAYG